MPTKHDPEQSFPSPRWEWKQVKMRRPAGGQKETLPKGGRWHRFPPRNPREPLSIKVKYRGGSEAWYEIHARGSVGRYPGYVSLHEIMSDINRAQP